MTNASELVAKEPIGVNEPKDIMTADHLDDDGRRSRKATLDLPLLSVSRTIDNLLKHELNVSQSPGMSVKPSTAITRRQFVIEKILDRSIPAIPSLIVNARNAYL